ncbi:MAG: translesion DNA synthesis-associated protein ImuA [Wenzhouxiangella sp.]|nr:MAG: translesion DNA synthesis-associated protein ImuA [Wenzhouxiangella sp.]
MAEIQALPPLDQLLRQRSDLWRGRRRPGGAALSSGRTVLDEWLPGGGWPCGRLTELLPSALGIGELSLLLPSLAAQTRQGRPVLLAAPPLVPCPQHLDRAGMDLQRLIIVRQAEQALWAAEQGLKSGLCGAVLVWHPRGRVKERSIRRLQLAAEQGNAPLFVYYTPGQHPPAALATLRLAIHPGPELELLRGDSAGRRIHLGRDNVVQLRSRKN